MELEKLAAEIHAQNVAVGWWDDFPRRQDRHYTAMMLVVTEWAEAAEGARKDLVDDHLPHRPMFDVELADAAIRLLDLAGAYQIEDLKSRCTWNLANRVSKLAAQPNRVAQLGLVVGRAHRSDYREEQVVDGLRWTLALAALHEIDLITVIMEKLEYNAQREDHKRENRAKAHGKKF